MKKGLFSIFVLSFLFLFNETVCADIAQGVKVIVLDAGHGGKDAGAVSGRTYEKDLNLDIILKLGSLIESRMPDIKVVYTRKTDTGLTLQQRADIAHKSHGDLYLSVHVNSAAKGAKGAETCIFSIDNTMVAVSRGSNGNADMDRAANRNSNMLSNRHSEDLVDLSQISNNAATSAYIKRMQYTLGEYSNALAELIQRNYAKSGRVVRGVKRGPFQVLWGIDMPSVLTEIGFLSNPDELKYMTSDKGKAEIAEDIYKAVAEYVGNINRALQKEKMDATMSQPTPAPAPAQGQPKSEPKKQQPVAKPAQEPKPAAPKNEKPATSENNAPAAETPKPAPQTQPAAPANAEKPSTPPAQTAPTSQHGFTVQIMASATQLKADDPRFKSCRGKVKGYISDGTYKYKYCVGFYTDRESAQAAASKIKGEFSGAFVIEVDGDNVVRK